jgi:hypothetical protein
MKECRKLQIQKNQLIEQEKIGKNCEEVINGLLEECQGKKLETNLLIIGLKMILKNEISLPF